MVRGRGSRRSGGPNFAPEDDPWLSKCTDVAFCAKVMTAGTRYGARPDGRLVKVNHNPGVNVAYRTSVLREVGGFDEGAIGAEDVLLDSKITKSGYSLFLDPTNVMPHRRRPLLRPMMRQIRNYGTSEDSRSTATQPSDRPCTYSWRLSPWWHSQACCPWPMGPSWAARTSTYGSHSMANGLYRGSSSTAPSGSRPSTWLCASSALHWDLAPQIAVHCLGILHLHPCCAHCLRVGDVEGRSGTPEGNISIKAIDDKER